MIQIAITAAAFEATGRTLPMVWVLIPIDRVL
jgi:hypothetical protein